MANWLMAEPLFETLKKRKRKNEQRREGRALVGIGIKKIFCPASCVPL